MLSLFLSCLSFAAVFSQVASVQIPAPGALIRQRRWANKLDVMLQESIATGNDGSIPLTETASTDDAGMPTPFDNLLATNFTSNTCPDFFSTFLSDPDFQRCPNLWLLLATSSSFFQVERSPNTTLPPLLDTACSPDPGEAWCEAKMGELAHSIQANSACGKDLAKGQPSVTQALQGFQSYASFRKATCIKDNSTGNYCFQEALSSKTPSQALYLYYLPLGMPLPNNVTTKTATTPACSSCNSNLMQTFARYASNATLPISQTYGQTRDLLTSTCGDSFAPAVIVEQTAKKSSAFRNYLSLHPAAFLFVSFLALIWVL